MMAEFMPKIDLAFGLLGADLWRAAGEYRFDYEPLRDSLRRCGAAAMVLLLWTLLTIGGGLIAARRLGSNP